MATEHFSDGELACHDHCGKLPPEHHQEELERYRVAFGRPLVVGSSARCPAWNQMVSTTGPRGPHTIAATDFELSGAEAHDFLVLVLVGPELWKAWHARGCPGWSGVGINQRGPVERRFIHVDSIEDSEHPRPRVWTY